MTTTATIQCRAGGHLHTHFSSDEVRNCYLNGGPYVPRSPAPAAATGAHSLPAPSRPLVGPVTERQLNYIESLGGKTCRWIAQRYLDKEKASELLDYLIADKKGTPVTEPTPTPAPTYTPPEPPKKDPKVAMIEGLIEMIPDAMYAVQAYEGGHVDFLRISRPKTGRMRGAIKIQTMHGSFGDGKYNTRAAFWIESKRLWVGYEPIIEMLLLLVTDPTTAAMLYATKAKRCCRCNAALTDARSRYYGIGPECEKLMPQIIEAVDMREALKGS